MNMISEQAEKLREIADYLLLGLSDRFDFTDVGHKIQEAADTMEALSAKLATVNMERSKENPKSDYRHCKDCENFVPRYVGIKSGKRGYCKKRRSGDMRWGSSRACKLFIDPMERSAEDCGDGWIYCGNGKNLPEDGVDVLVWYEYFRYGEYNRLFQTTGISFTYNGKWSGFVNGQSGWDQLSIIAWQPLPEPYHEP